MAYSALKRTLRQIHKRMLKLVDIFSVLLLFWHILSFRRSDKFCHRYPMEFSFCKKIYFSSLPSLIA
ncbi:Hypothetical protein BN2458_PEG0330 [Helicobacter typhlonius]|uniref:Uncharacterized protein n=1 Tax=Helicobacter typhlonius TaxID=76936 RepID=A0A0S4PT25_9HELI|nr:Hypothetical protein BN2458_PEG0330 [Helicobacter typhlonius]